MVVIHFKLGYTLFEWFWKNQQKYVGVLLLGYSQRKKSWMLKSPILLKQRIRQFLFWTISSTLNCKIFLSSSSFGWRRLLNRGWESYGSTKMAQPKFTKSFKRISQREVMWPLPHHLWEEGEVLMLYNLVLNWKIRGWIPMLYPWPPYRKITLALYFFIFQHGLPLH